MNKFLVPVAGSVLLLALGAAVSAGCVAPGLVHGAAALRAVAACGSAPVVASATDALDVRARAAARARGADSEAARMRKMPLGRAAFVISPFGPVTATALAALPADPSAHPRSGLELTRAQAQDLARTLGGDVVWVDADCCDEQAWEHALGFVAGMMAARNLAADTPVLVTGATAATAATLVDQLNQHGYTHVALVAR